MVTVSTSYFRHVIEEYFDNLDLDVVYQRREMRMSFIGLMTTCHWRNCGRPVRMTRSKFTTGMKVIGDR